MVETRRQNQELTVGKPLKRAEDPRFVVGAARFVDDIKLQGTLYATFVRSPYPHARIKSIDVSKALKSSGVYLVLTARDLAGKIGEMPTVEGDKRAKPTRRHVLAFEESRYEGEAVAMVVAEDMYVAADAAELVEVEWEPLPSVTDPEKALNDQSPVAGLDRPDNVAYRYTFETPGFKDAFSAADTVIEARLVNQRVAPSPMETRSVLAVYEPGIDLLTVYISHQDPFAARDAIASILGRPKPSVRIISPDVGGAFGSKISIYPEDAAVSYAAVLLRRPVKWIESRRENLMTTTHGRGQIQLVKAAVKKDGRVLALDIRIIADSGAYTTDGSVYTPKITPEMASGNYDIRGIKAELVCALTNKVPQDAYRGAGRPEATFLIERMMNLIARELKIDPVELRLKNFVRKDMFPYKNASGRFTYDIGDYEGGLKKATKVVSYDRLREDQARALSQGRLIGVGVASYVEVCGFGPNYPQTASVTVTEDGKVIINSGTHPHGQGHHTPFAQVVSDELGVDVSDVYFNHGDTSSLPYGTVTAGSRSGPVGGSAVLLAARKIRKKMETVARKLLGVDGEIQFRDGKIIPLMSPEKTMTFREVAEACYNPSKLPQDMEPTLYEYAAYAPAANTFPAGTHVAVVEVDRETGSVRLLKYVAVDDIGRVLNPLVAEGQVHGGVVQGLGQALLEAVSYGQDGQLLTSTLSEYLLPTACEAPQMIWERTETYTASNLLGVKGVGETGAIASTPAVANAVEDALFLIGKHAESMPLTPEYTWSILKADPHHH